MERLATDRHYFAQAGADAVQRHPLLLPDVGAGEGLERRDDVHRGRRGVPRPACRRPAATSTATRCSAGRRRARARRASACRCRTTATARRISTWPRPRSRSSSRPDAAQVPMTRCGRRSVAHAPCPDARRRGAALLIAAPSAHAVAFRDAACTRHSADDRDGARQSGGRDQPHRRGGCVLARRDRCRHGRRVPPAGRHVDGDAASSGRHERLQYRHSGGRRRQRDRRLAAAVAEHPAVERIPARRRSRIRPAGGDRPGGRLRQQPGGGARWPCRRSRSPARRTTRCERPSVEPGEATFFDGGDPGDAPDDLLVSAAANSNRNATDAAITSDGFTFVFWQDDWREGHQLLGARTGRSRVRRRERPGQPRAVDNVFSLTSPTDSGGIAVVNWIEQTGRRPRDLAQHAADRSRRGNLHRSADVLERQPGRPHPRSGVQADGTAVRVWRESSRQFLDRSPAPRPGVGAIGGDEIAPSDVRTRAWSPDRTGRPGQLGGR